MATFDPKQKRENRSDALAAGIYGIAMTHFERKTSAKNRPYMRAKFDVIAGSQKGKSFFSSVGIDDQNEGVMARLQMYAECVGLTEAFDLDSDEAFARAFLGKPFVAQIAVTQNGQYVNNDVKKYVTEPSDRQRDIMAAWQGEHGDDVLQKWLDKHCGSADDFKDDDGFGGGGSDDDFGGGDDFGSNSSTKVRGGEDDDIPF